MKTELRGESVWHPYSESIYAESISAKTGPQDQSSNFLKGNNCQLFVKASSSNPVLWEVRRIWGMETLLGIGDSGSGEQCYPGCVTRPFWALNVVVGGKKNLSSLKINQEAVGLK